jgi:hypothetical protein
MTPNAMAEGSRRVARRTLAGMAAALLLALIAFATGIYASWELAQLGPSGFGQGRGGDAPRFCRVKHAKLALSSAAHTRFAEPFFLRRFAALHNFNLCLAPGDVALRNSVK